MEKKLTPEGCLPLPMGYISVYDHCFQTSSLKSLGQSKQKLHVECPWVGGMKVYIICLGHMTKMSTMPIYGKNNHYLLSNQNSNDLEIWHEALLTVALQMMYIIDNHLFYGKV